MPITVACPNCQKIIKAPDKYAGKQARCAACGAAVPVPGHYTEPERQEAAGDSPAPIPVSRREPATPTQVIVVDVPLSVWLASWLVILTFGLLLFLLLIFCLLNVVGVFHFFRQEPT